MASEREEAGEESGEKVRKKMAGDVLTCSVCLERYRCPKLLPCFHTFCQRCVEKVAGTRPSFPCPTCRTVTVMPPGGAAHLQVSAPVLDRLVQIGNNNRGQKKRK